MTIPKATTTPDPLEGFSQSVTIEPFKFQSEADSNLDLLLYGRPVNLTSDDGKCEHVPLSKVTSYAAMDEMLEHFKSASAINSTATAEDQVKIHQLMLDNGIYDNPILKDWILSNRNLVEDILKEGEK